MALIFSDALELNKYERSEARNQNRERRGSLFVCDIQSSEMDQNSLCIFHKLLEIATDWICFKYSSIEIAACHDSSCWLIYFETCFVEIVSKWLFIFVRNCFQQTRSVAFALT